MIGGGALDTRGLGRLLLLGVLWGATFPITRLGIEAGAPPFLLVTIVLFRAAAVTGVVAAVARDPFPSSKDLLLCLGIGAGVIGVANLTLFWGEQYSTGGIAAIVFATAPFISTVASFRPGTSVGLGPLQAAGPVLGLLGVVVLAVPSTGALVVSSGWGIGGLFVGAAAQGVRAVCVARWRPAGVDRDGVFPSSSPEVVWPECPSSHWLHPRCGSRWGPRPYSRSFTWPWSAEPSVGRSFSRSFIGRARSAPTR